MQQEFEGRTRVEHTDPQFEGRFIPLYKALCAEYGAAVRSRKEAAIQSGAPDNWTRPQQYALAVPESIGDRTKLVDDLLGMFQASFRARDGFTEGQKPSEGRPSPDAVFEEDLKALCGALIGIMPAPESSDFADFLRMRVNVNTGLVRGGFVEAMAVLQRFQLKYKQTDGTINAATHLAKSVPGAKGFVSVSELDTDSRTKLIGGRIIKLDDRINIPAIVEQNRGLYEELTATFEDAETQLKSVIDAFNAKVDGFATKLQPRDSQFIRVQWFNVLLTQIRTRLDCSDEEVGAKLTQIAEGLNLAQDANAFMQVINNVGIQIQ